MSKIYKQINSMDSITGAAFGGFAGGDSDGFDDNKKKRNNNDNSIKDADDGREACQILGDAVSGSTGRAGASLGGGVSQLCTTGVNNVEAYNNRRDQAINDALGN